MPGNEQEYFFKGFFIIFSALFGLLILIFIQIKNIGVRLKPRGRRISDIKNNLHASTQTRENTNLTFHPFWTYANEGFSIKKQNQYIIWQIGISKIYSLQNTTTIRIIDGHSWFTFANSKKNTEKIIVPIIRKAFKKYKKNFESETSIRFDSENAQEELVTWLQNESQIIQTINHFLDECIYIAQQLHIKQNLLVTLGDSISLEVTMPHQEYLTLFEKEFNNLYAVEFENSTKEIKIRLWIAFPHTKIPSICLQKYESPPNHFDKKNAS